MTFDELQEHADCYDGYCTNCKEVTKDGGCEPDAREYPCPQCNLPTVYGIEEAALMGYITLEEP